MPAAAIYNIAEAADPKAEALKHLGDLNKITVAPPKLLVWIYIEPSRTKGGIILTNKETRENIYQGQVGLVLKSGAAAFKDDDQHKFHGFKAEVGDWIVFKPGNAPRVQINGVDCRYIEDTQVDLVVDSPEVITHRQ